MEDTFSAIDNEGDSNDFLSIDDEKTNNTVLAPTENGVVTTQPPMSEDAIVNKGNVIDHLSEFLSEPFLSEILFESAGADSVVIEGFVHVRELTATNNVPGRKVW